MTGSTSLAEPENLMMAEADSGHLRGRLVLVRHRNADPPLMKLMALSAGRRRRGRLFYGASEPAY